MSDYTLKCVNCFHNSHENKACPYCDPKQRCTEFVRADLFIARSMARIEGVLQQSHGQTLMALSTIFDLLAEAYPEAATTLKAKLEERQAASEAAMEAQHAASLKEADEALAAANAEEQERTLDALAEDYAKNNVLQFPVVASNNPADLVGFDVEDTPPEVV